MRFLRRLVTVLTTTMILGVLTIVVLLVIRLQTPDSLPTPDALALPDGQTAYAVTQTPRAWIVVTTDNRLFIFDLDGTLRSETTLP